MLPALPVSGSTSITTELNTTGPRSSVVKRGGSWLRKASMTDWASIPRLEWRGGAGRQPRAAGGVLAVGDDEVNAVAAPDAGQSTGQGPASPLPHHIADHKYVHCGSHLLEREAATGPTLPPSGKLLRVLHRAPFADNGDLDLPRVVQVLLYLLADLLRHSVGAEVVDLFGLDDDAYLAAGLDGERLLHAREGVGHRLPRFQPLG